MKKFAANTDCVITYDLAENDYEQVTGYSWVLKDEKGDTLTSSSDTSISPSDDATSTNPSEEVGIYQTEENVEKIEVKIDKKYNQLAEGETLGYRRLVINISDNIGTSTDSVEYILEGELDLIPMKNSYQTFGEAQLNVAKISGLDDWESIPMSTKLAALITAYNKIGKLNFAIPVKSDSLSEDAHTSIFGVTQTEIEIPNLNSLSLDEFEALDEGFKNAIKMAQVVEANSVSGFDAATEMKRNNVLSYTIGETSQMFKTGNTYVSSLCSDAMDILNGYIVRKLRIARS